MPTTTCPLTKTSAPPNRKFVLPPVLFGYLACLTALGVRLYDLASQSIWLDEGATYYFASLPVRTLIVTTFQSEPNPPLYYLLVHYWMSLVGSGEFALRFLSVVAGVALVALVYRLGADIAGRATAAGAAFLAAVSPYLIWYSQEARMYSLLACLGVASLLALWKALGRGSWQTWLVFGVLLALTLYTHVYGVFILLAAAAFTLVRLAVMTWILLVQGQALVHVPTKARSNAALVAHHAEMIALRSMAGLGLLTFVGAVALYLPWLMANLGAGAAGPGWRSTVNLVDVFSRSFTTFAHGGYLPPAYGDLLAGVQASLVALSVLMSLEIGRGRGWVGVLVATAVLLPSLAIAALGRSYAIFAERYVVGQAPFFYLGVAAGLSQALRRAPTLFPVGLTALCVVSLIAVSTSRTDPQYRKEDFRSAASFLGQRSTPNDLILLVADYVQLPFGYYYRGPAQVLPVAGAPDSAAESIDQLSRDKQSIWLLESHAEQVDPEGLIQKALAARLPLITEAFPQGIRLRGYRAAFELDQLPVDAIPVGRMYGGAFELVGYRSDNGIPAVDTLFHPPSNWLHVTLYWRAISLAPDGVRTSVRLVDTRGVWGDSLARSNDALAIHPPGRWSPGRIVAHDVDVNLNPATPPGTFQLEVRMLGSDGQPLAVNGGTGVVGAVQIVAPRS